MSSSADFGRLVTDFVRGVPGVAHAVVIAADGRLLAASADLPAGHARQLTGVASGLMRLARGAADAFHGGAVTQTVIEMELGFLFLMSVADGRCVAALASPKCDIGDVAYEMAKLVDRLSAGHGRMDGGRTGQG